MFLLEIEICGIIFQEPVVEFDVESQFEGRPVPQITSLIINQVNQYICIHIDHFAVFNVG